MTFNVWNSLIPYTGLLFFFFAELYYYLRHWRGKTVEQMASKRHKDAFAADQRRLVEINEHRTSRLEKQASSARNRRQSESVELSASRKQKHSSTARWHRLAETEEVNDCTRTKQATYLCQSRAAHKSAVNAIGKRRFLTLFIDFVASLLGFSVRHTVDWGKIKAKQLKQIMKIDAAGLRFQATVAKGFQSPCISVIDCFMKVCF